MSAPAVTRISTGERLTFAGACGASRFGWYQRADGTLILLDTREVTP